MSEESIKIYFSADTYNSIEEFKKDVLANFTTILTELSAIFYVDRHIDVDNFKPLFKTETVYKVAHHISSKTINYVLILNQPHFKLKDNIFVGDLQLKDITLNQHFELDHINLQYFLSDVCVKPHVFELIKIKHSVKEQDNDIRVQYGIDSSNNEQLVINGPLKEAVDQAVILFQKVKTNLMEKSV
jgi:hypothetical protein